MSWPWSDDSLTVSANPFLERPSLRWFIRLHLANSFPILFPYAWNAAPLRVSTIDEYPEGDIGPHLYEGRLLDMQDVSRTAPDAYGAGGIGGFSLRLAARDPDSAYPNLHDWVGMEHRGKYVDADAMDMETGEVALGIFRGEIVSMQDDLHTVQVLCRPHDPLTWRDQVPSTLVSPATYPYAPTDAGGLGSVTNLGIGVGRRIPCRPVKAPHVDGTLVETVVVPDHTTDILTATAHDFLTGAGPYRLRTTDALPTGLSATVDYYVIVVDEDTIRVALTPGDALGNVAVALDDDGAGDLVLYGGLPANLDDDYDFEVGHGNIGILRVWENDIPSGAQLGAVSDLPDTYTVLHRAAAPDGKYVTTVRFREPMDGVAITADVVGVYREVDDSTVGDWKFLRGFGDDIGGHDLVSGSDAHPVTTADMVPHRLGIGLGGVKLDGHQFLKAPTLTTGQQTFSIEIECTPTGTGINYLWCSPQASLIAAGVFAWWDGDDELVKVLGYYEDGSFLVVETDPGSAPRGKVVRVSIRRDLATGKSEVLLGQEVVFTETNTARILYRNDLSPMMLGGIAGAVDAGTNFTGILGYACPSVVARTDRELARAYYLMRRNGVEFLRDVAAAVKKPVNEESFAQAAADWDAVEGGALHCDGWLTQPNEVRNVFYQLVPFRDLSLGLDTRGRLTVDVATPPTAIDAQFGVGDQYGNLIGEPQRVKASLTESARELVVQYRRPRNGAGALERYITRKVSLAGEAKTTVSLDFVDDPITADIVCDFLAKRRKTREQALDIAWGHEGRHLEPGSVARVRLPDMGLDPIDLELISVAQGPGRGAGRGVPVGLADFDYTPKLLAADPPETIHATLDLTNAVLVAQIDGQTVQVGLRFRHERILRPVSAGGAQQFPIVVGATSHHDAVDDVTPDDNTSYVQGGPGQYERFMLEPIGETQGAIARVALTARLDALSVNGTVRFFWRTPDRGVDLNDPVTVTAAGGYADYTETVDSINNHPWRLEDLNPLEGGIQLVGGDQTRLTQLFATATIDETSTPKGLGHVRYYVKGPSASEPDPPTESDPSFVPAAIDLGSQTDFVSGSSGDKFWYWAGVYTPLRQLIGLVGPTSVTLP